MRVAAFLPEGRRETRSRFKVLARAKSNLLEVL
jgi:hypothetical protein